MPKKKASKKKSSTIKKQRGGSVHRNPALDFTDWFERQTSDWTPAQRAANQARAAAHNRRGQARRQLEKAPPPRRVNVRGAGGAKAGGSTPEVNQALAARGYQVGGMLMPPSRPSLQNFQGAIAGGPPKRRRALPPHPRRRRGPGPRGRDV